MVTHHTLNKRNNSVRRVRQESMLTEELVGSVRVLRKTKPQSRSMKLKIAVSAPGGYTDETLRSMSGTDLVNLRVKVNRDIQTYHTAGVYLNQKNPKTGEPAGQASKVVQALTSGLVAQQELLVGEIQRRRHEARTLKQYV